MYHSGSQISEQDNHGVQRKFAFSRRFVRGSVGTPVGIPSISSNHWIHCLAPFILDLGSSRTSDCVRLCYSDQLLDIRHRTRSFFIWLNPRGEIFFSLKELIATFKRVRFTTCRDTRLGRTLWNEEIVSAGRIPCCAAWFCIRPVPEELPTQASTP